MQCGKCKFVVPNNMRFCLMKNMCPSCGTSLFSESDMNHLTMLQTRINGKSFSKSFDQVQVYDLALFIYNELKSGYGRTILEEELKILQTKSKSEDGAEVEYNQEGESGSDDDSQIQNEEPSEELSEEVVRREIEEELREQILANINENDFAKTSNYNDNDDKVERLKAQYRKVGKTVSGASVRRVG